MRSARASGSAATLQGRNGGASANTATRSIRQTRATAPLEAPILASRGHGRRNHAVYAGGNPIDRLAARRRRHVHDWGVHPRAPRRRGGAVHRRVALGPVDSCVTGARELKTVAKTIYNATSSCEGKSCCLRPTSPSCSALVLYSSRRPSPTLSPRLRS